MNINNSRLGSKDRVNKHYGMHEYFQFYKRGNNRYNNINYIIFSKVISRLNLKLGDILIEKRKFRLPYVGMLNVYQEHRVPYIKDDKVRNAKPVDWLATKKLWSENEEAYNKKVVVRYSNKDTGGYVFRFYYSKFQSTMKNKQFYYIEFVRSLKIRLKERIQDPIKTKYKAFNKPGHV